MQNQTSETLFGAKNASPMQDVHHTISFCIPTKDRPSELKTAIDSILRQSAETIEIVIVDGGHYEKTAELISTLPNSKNRIRHYRGFCSKGVHHDINLAVSLAQGEYCWLFSDDDALEDGAIALVLRKLSENKNIVGLTLNYQAYDKSLAHKIKTVRALSRQKKPGDYTFYSKRDLFVSMTMHLGFISCQIVRREAWLLATKYPHQNDMGNEWVIPYIIGRMMDKTSLWQYVDCVCVRYRSSNDSFLKRCGVVQRQVIANTNFLKIMDALFPDDNNVVKSIKDTILVDRIPRNIVVLKSLGLKCFDQYKIFKIYIDCYSKSSNFWLLIVPLFLIPNVVFKGLRVVYFIYIKYRNR